MKISVLLFASIKEYAGTDKIFVDIENSKANHKNLKLILGNIGIYCNRKPNVSANKHAGVFWWVARQYLDTIHYTTVVVGPICL